VNRWVSGEWIVSRTDAKQRRMIHYWLTILWLTAGSVVWFVLRDLLWFVGFMSLYAIWISHLAGWAARRPSRTRSQARRANRNRPLKPRRMQARQPSLSQASARAASADDLPEGLLEFRGVLMRELTSAWRLLTRGGRLHRRGRRLYSGDGRSSFSSMPATWPVVSSPRRSGKG